MLFSCGPDIAFSFCCTQADGKVNVKTSLRSSLRHAFASQELTCRGSRPQIKWGLVMACLSRASRGSISGPHQPTERIAIINMGFYLRQKNPNALSSEVFVSEKHGTCMSFPWLSRIWVKFSDFQRSHSRGNPAGVWLAFCCYGNGQAHTIWQPRFESQRRSQPHCEASSRPQETFDGVNFAVALVTTGRWGILSPPPWTATGKSLPHLLIHQNRDSHALKIGRDAEWGRRGRRGHGRNHLGKNGRESERMKSMKTQLFLPLKSCEKPRML